MTEKRWFARHRDDKGVDEILFVPPGTEQTVAAARATAFLRIGLIERYKTSGLSGDEWRFSTGLYLRFDSSKPWELISTCGSLDAHCAQLFPELFGDNTDGKRPDLFTRAVGGIAFQWKGQPVTPAK